METTQTKNEPELHYVAIKTAPRDAEEFLGRLLVVIQTLEDARLTPKTPLPVIDIDS